METEEEDTEIWIGWTRQTYLPAMTLEQMREATAKDPELSVILKEKKTGKRSQQTSKGLYDKIWEDLREREGVLLKGVQMVVPKELQAQAIALAHKGHMQTDGTMWQLSGSVTCARRYRHTWHPANARRQRPGT